MEYSGLGWVCGRLDLNSSYTIHTRMLTHVEIRNETHWISVLDLDPIR